MPVSNLFLDEPISIAVLDQMCHVGMPKTMQCQGGVEACFAPQGRKSAVNVFKGDPCPTFGGPQCRKLSRPTQGPTFVNPLLHPRYPPCNFRDQQNRPTLR